MAATQTAAPEQFSYKSAIAGYSGRSKAQAAAAVTGASVGTDSILSDEELKATGTNGATAAGSKLGVA